MKLNSSFLKTLFIIHPQDQILWNFNEYLQEGERRAGEREGEMYRCDCREND